MPLTRTRLAITSLLFCLFGLIATGCWPADASGLELFPKHFLLHPGEQIHYQVRVREGERSQSVPDYQFAIEGNNIVDQSSPEWDDTRVKRRA